LLAAAGDLAVIELDRDFIETLKTRCTDAGRLAVQTVDAAGFDFSDLTPGDAHHQG